MREDKAEMQVSSSFAEACNELAAVKNEVKWIDSLQNLHALNVSVPSHKRSVTQLSISFATLLSGGKGNSYWSL